MNGGNWSVSNGELNLSNQGSGSGKAAVFAPSIGKNDYVVETDLFPIQGNSMGGPLYEYNDHNNYYAMHSMPGSNLVMKSQITNGGANYGASWPVSHTHGRWYTFRTDRGDGVNKVYFNDTYVSTHGQVFNDGAGVWGYSGPLKFDNFRVREYASSIPNTVVGTEEANALASDNCGISTVVNTFNGTANASGLYPVGTTPVVVTVTDQSGNASTCEFNATVEDNTAPTVTVQSAIVYLDAFGNGSITTTDIDNGSNDACGIASIVLDNSTFNCSNVGENTVVLTVTDNNGNITSTSSTVTVIDSTSPIAFVQAATVYLDASGNGSITTTDIDNGSNDACGIASLSLNNISFNCSHVQNLLAPKLQVIFDFSKGGPSEYGHCKG